MILELSDKKREIYREREREREREFHTTFGTALLMER